MKVFTRIAAAALIASAFVAAAPRAEAHYESTFFPMHVGNEWVYQHDGFAANGQTTRVYCDSSWTSSVTGNIYFRLRNLDGNYHWLRQTSAGRIYEYPGTLLCSRLHAEVGWTWTRDVDTSGTHGGDFCSDGVIAEMVSTSEQIIVPAGRFDTVHIRYRSRCSDAGFADEWFARGVGLVQRQTHSIGGPQFLVLKSAKISGRTIPSYPVRLSVSTDQPEYWENHMPTIGGPPQLGPEITINVDMRPVANQSVVINYTDPVNEWNIDVIDANGNGVWMNPRSRVMAPAGGVNKTIPVTGKQGTFKFQLPYGTAPGTYRVRATAATNTLTPTVETTFSYGWAM